jgi:hypothetical protein
MILNKHAKEKLVPFSYSIKKVNMMTKAASYFEVSSKVQDV